MPNIANKLVNDIQVGSPDERGKVVEQMFARVSTKYCVYKAVDDSRIMIQFADDESVGDAQRLRLSELEPERSTINAEFDGWESAVWKTVLWKWTRGRYAQMAAGFNQRIAQGAISALNGNPVLGKSQLASVLEDLRAERLSIGRVEYFLTALGVGLIFVVLAAVLDPSTAACATPSSKSPVTFGCFVAGGGLFVAIGMATLGALFSIAMAIRDRHIQTDKSRRSNILDASLRVGVAAVASIILFALLFSGYVKLSFGTTEVTGDMSVSAWPAMVVAFIAGFFERLVSNFLVANPATLALAGAAGAPPVGQTKSTSTTGTGNNGGGGGQSTEPSAGTASPTPDANSPSSTDTDAAEAEEEVALTASPGEGATATESTNDDELPPAFGGVENETR